MSCSQQSSPDINGQNSPLERLRRSLQLILDLQYTQYGLIYSRFHGHALLVSTILD